MMFEGGAAYGSSVVDGGKGGKGGAGDLLVTAPGGPPSTPAVPGSKLRDFLAATPANAAMGDFSTQTSPGLASAHKRAGAGAGAGVGVSAVAADSGSRGSPTPGACDEYRVLIYSGAASGTMCMCGWPKKSHAAAAFAEAKRKEKGAL